MDQVIDKILGKANTNTGIGRAVNNLQTEVPVPEDTDLHFMEALR